jgi:Tfp pilus assembly protein FimT
MAEVVVVVFVIALLVGIAIPTVGAALDDYRGHGATADLFAALHRTRARARATGVTHGLLLDGDGRAFRIVADPGGGAETVEGPRELVDGAVAAQNAPIRFSPKGFAIPAGTITIRSGSDVRRVVVNLLGRVRIAPGETDP